jgi:site-specific DNA recombinase
MTKVAIYARISSVRPRKGQATEDALNAIGTAGVDRQVADCREKARSLGFEVVAEFVDNNASAYNRQKVRPEWKKLKELIAAGGINGVVVWHTDRLYRHPSDLNEILHLIELGEGLQIYSCKSGQIDLNTSSGKMVARILGDVAWQEVEHKAERQNRQILETAKQGLSHGGPVPFGYKLGKNPGERVIDDENAAHLKEAVRQYLDDGVSLNGITEYLRQTLDRPTLKPVSVKAMLTRPALIGVRQHVPVKERRRHEALRNAGKATGDIPLHVARYPASWEPILDEETHARLVARLFDPTNAKVGRHRKSILSGVLKCGLCGTTMSYSSTSYKCSYTAGGCAKISISTKGVESLITDLVPKILASGSITMKPLAPLDRSQDEIELDRLLKKQNEYHELFKAGYLLLAELTEHLDDLKEKILAIDAVHVAASRLAEQQQVVINGSLHWQSTNNEDRRVIIRSLFNKIVVMPSENGKKAGPKIDPARLRLFIGQPLPVDSLAPEFTGEPMPIYSPTESKVIEMNFLEWQAEMDSSQVR